MDSRTKFRGYVEAIHGGGASNLLLPDVSDPGIAYLSSGGNDGNAVVGDPFRPFATAQAAITAAIAEGGDCVLSAGKGSFGDMDITGAASLTLLGLVGYVSSFGDIVSSTACSIYGNGNVMVGNITFQMPNGTTGSDGPPDTNEAGEDGGNGGDTSDVSVSKITISGNVILSGGNGGNGGNGADASVAGSFSPGPGGNGGSAGEASTLALYDCEIAGYAVSIPGNGGNGGNGGNALDYLQTGGKAGNGCDGLTGGTVNLVRTTFGATYAAGGAAGVAGSGGYGLTDTGNGGYTGTPGSPGIIYTEFSKSSTYPTNGESYSFRASLINGNWYS